MSKQQFVNNFESDFVAAVLANPITGTPATELGYGILQLQLPAGAVLGTLAAGEYMKLTLFKRASGVQSDFEIVKVLGINEAGYSSGTETRIRVERAQEGTTAKAYAIGDFISCRWTAASAENALYMDGDLAGLASVSAARANLGLGTAAVANTGTGAGNVILGNDSRLTDSRTPTGAAGGVLSGTFPNPGFASPMATTADLVAGLASREPSVTAGTTAQYWRGDKTWRDFFADVRAAILTGLSTATATAVTAADTVLAAIGKLQAQVSARLPLAGGTLTGDLTLPSLNGGPLAGLRNRVINGNLDVWQRGTTFSGADVVLRTADMCTAYQAGAAVTVSRQDLPVGQTQFPGAKHFLRAGLNSGGSGAFIDWRMEDVATLNGQQVTVSFGYRANAPRTVDVTLRQNFGVGGSATVVTTVGALTLTATSTFAKWSATVNLPSIAGKTVGPSSRLSLTFENFSATGLEIDITQIQVEQGPVATPFEQRPLALEELLCQRYLPVSTGPHLQGGSYNALAAYFHEKFTIPARVAPTGILLTGPLSSYYVRDELFNSYALTGGSVGFGYGATDGASFFASAAVVVWADEGVHSTLYLSGNKILWTGAEL